MKLFFASSCTSQTHKACWRAADIKRYLFSYGNGQAQYRENRELYDDPENEIIVDSGAFTAWTKGKPINLAQYIDFCKKVQDEAKAQVLFVNLDVIPGSFGRRPTEFEREDSAFVGWSNYTEMRREGLTVMHVYHQHESLFYLDLLADTGDIFGVSPANDVSAKERGVWLCKVFDRLASRRPFPRTHGFGVTTSSLVEDFPFYQVDSTSWLASSLYGTVPVPTGRGIVAMTKRDALLRAGQGRLGIEAAKNLAPCVEGGYRFCTVESLEAYKDLEYYATRLWSQRGVDWQD